MEWMSCVAKRDGNDAADRSMSIVEHVVLLSQILYKDSEHSAATVQQQEKQAGKLDEGTTVACAH